MTDAAYSYFTVKAGGQSKTVEYYAMGLAASPGITGTDAGDMTKLQAIATRLKSFDAKALSPGDGMDEGPYVPEAVQIWVGKIDSALPPNTVPGQQPPREWPLPDLSLASLTMSSRPDYLPALITGAPAGGLYAEAAANGGGSAFREGTTSYMVWVKPLLPHEGPTTSGQARPPHITSVHPAEGSTVDQATLRRDGIGAGFGFRAGNGLGLDPASRVQIYLDGAQVNASSWPGQFAWTTTADIPPSNGGLTLGVEKPFPTGKHKVVVRYTDTKDQAFFYTWEFTATP